MAAILHLDSKLHFWQWLGAAFIAFAVAWILVRGLIRWAPRLGLVDRPNERSSHTRATPRGGGIGFVLPIIVLGCLAPFFLGISGLGLWLVFIVAALGVAAISLWDDFRSLPAALRLLCHFCAAGILLYWSSEIDLKVPYAGLSRSGIPGIVFALVWVVGLTNVYNFMDGIDGIAGLQGVIGGLAWSWVGYQFNYPFLFFFGGFVSGGCLGFLVHNWSPAKIFMGDVGSAFLGFVFGGLPLVTFSAHASNEDSVVIARLPFFAALAVWPFIADGSFTFLRRLLKGEPVWRPHRSHLYQRLVQAGWSHASVVFYYGIWAVVSMMIGFRYLASLPLAWVITFQLVSLAITWLTIVSSEIRAKAQSK